MSDPPAEVSYDLPLLDVAPPPDEQMAIVTALEEDDESLHVYSVSKDWYERWRLYVGLSPSPCSHTDRKTLNPPTSSPKQPNNNAPAKTLPGEGKTKYRTPPREYRTNHTSPPGECSVNYSQSDECSGVSPKASSRCGSGGPGGVPFSPPGPLTMDLADDDGNIYADERIWRCWVRWYGVSPSHELDRRNWASDDKDFEICVLSPYCGLIENPVKTFDVSEESGYVELQLRQIFRVPRHRSTRLWICEKARHSRFQPLLARDREICSHDFVDAAKSYILALEVANLDGTWPTLVPGDPSGTFDVYRDLTEGGPRESPVLWEAGLAETLETVFGAISTELKETGCGIVSTAKCVTAIKERELDEVKEALRSKMDRYETSEAKVEERVRDLRQEERSLEEQRKKLDSDKEAFQLERHKFAEELVRMHTIHVIHDSRARLNVGGHVFVTSTFTLTRDPDSMLAAMFSGRHALKAEDDGSYFVDRDGTHFRYVLNFLRDGNFRPGTLPTDRTFLNELLSEAEYFQISGLVQLLTDCLKGAEGGESGVNSSPEGSGPTSGSSAKTYFGCAIGPTGGGYHGRMGPSPQGKRVTRKTSAGSQKPQAPTN